MTNAEIVDLAARFDKKKGRHRLRVIPTASGYDRADKCPAAFALPQAKEGPSDASEFGTKVHAFMALAREGGFDAALAMQSLEESHYSFVEQIPWEQLPQGGRAEVAFAFNFVTGEGRELGVLKDARAYAIDPTCERAGTADLVGLVGDIVHIYDWKTGYRVLTPAADAWQLKLLALAAARAYDASGAEVAFMRLGDDGRLFVDRASFDAFDLMRIEQELIELEARLQVAADRAAAGEQLDVAMGSHCDFCAAKPHCPGQTSAALAIAGFKPPAELTPEIAGQAYTLIKQYTDILERAEKQIREYAKINPVPLPGGKELRRVDWPVTKVDYTLAHQVLVERFGAERASDAVQTSISKTAIEDVCARVASITGAKAGPLKRDVIAELDKRRGINRYTQPQVRVSKARAK